MADQKKPHEVIVDLRHFLDECNDKVDDKSGLKKLYKEILAYLKRNDYDCVILETQKKYAPSNKWPRLILHTIFVHGTIAGIITGFLPILISAGFITLTISATVLAVYVLPLVAALPYFLFKMFGDVSKEERALRIQEIVVNAELHVLDKYDEDQSILVKKNRLTMNHRDSLHQKERDRGFFNSTLLETMYLSGSLFPLGMSLLVTFSMLTPMNCLAVILFSIAVGIVYAHFHHQVVIGIEKKRSQIKQKVSVVENLRVALFQERREDIHDEVIVPHVSTSVFN